MKIHKSIVLLSIILILFISGIVAISYRENHIFTLSGDERIKSEQIQPIFTTVKVTGTMDTDVIFTDVETGEKYTIGYITPGMGGSIELEKGKWYIVEGNGSLTLKLVNVRVE
jgi:hypothetical protein